MSKKKKKKHLEKIIRRDAHITREIMRNHYNDIINDLYKIGQISADTHNLMIECINELRCGEGETEAVISAPEKIEVTGISKKIKKKIKKYVKKEVQKCVRVELEGMCGAILKYIYEDINKMIENSSCGCKGDNKPKVEVHSLSSEEGLKKFEELCENILGIPAELILGPNYRDKICREKDEEESSEEDLNNEEGDESEVIENKENEPTLAEDIAAADTDEVVASEEHTTSNDE